MDSKYQKSWKKRVVQSKLGCWPIVSKKIQITIGKKSIVDHYLLPVINIWIFASAQKGRIQILRWQLIVGFGKGYHFDLKN